MSDFETLVANAVDNHEIAGLVLAATNRDGSFTYNKSFGTSTLHPSKPHTPVTDQTIVYTASCTKLITSVAALQLVDRGLLSLDAPVYDHIPELKSWTVITSIDEATGVPVEHVHEKEITLRHLLTHTSGLTYEMLSPKAMAWLKHRGEPLRTSGKIFKRFDIPLQFEPGESWQYGSSTEFAGLLVERVSGLRLDEYMRQNIWEPLGIRDMTFFPASRPDLKDRFADMTWRDEDGKIAFGDGRLPIHDENMEQVSDCFGGAGIYACASEYLKVLHAVLIADEDEKILKKSTIEEMFRPQLSENPSAALNATLQIPAFNAALGNTSSEIKKDWGLGGLLTLEASPAGDQRAGTMIWGGLPNLLWWIDRKAGLCGLVFAQLMPTGDRKTGDLGRKSIEGIYDLYSSQKIGPNVIS